MKLSVTLTGIFLMLGTQQSQALNPIQIENNKVGTAGWELLKPATNHEIEGYASRTSVNRGEQISFFINVIYPQITIAPTYRIEVYRMGWYGGVGARLVLGPIDGLTGVQQTVADDCIHDSTQPNGLKTAYTAFGLIDCSWTPSYTLTVPNNPTDPTDWTSGAYLAKLTITSGLNIGKQSYIIFVVRDDNRQSDLLFQSSATTYQAYNNWPGTQNGGKSLYPTNSSGPVIGIGTNVVRAVKVSFNRPYGIRNNGEPAQQYAEKGVGAGEFLTTLSHSDWTTARASEYNMVRFLEREGYDVSYSTDIDTHLRADKLLNHAAFLSVGHDEYWTMAMRRNVEAARDHGVNLAFFSANTCYWQIRLENSAGATGDRVIVSYKDDLATYDPQYPSNTTTTWFHHAIVNMPEDQLMGVRHAGGAFYKGFASHFSGNIQVTNRSHWAFDGTSLPVSGGILPGMAGYETDEIQFAAPANLTTLSHSAIFCPDCCPACSPPGSWANSDMTIYTASSGARVFATGTIHWSWGLDNYSADSDPNNSTIACLPPSTSPSWPCLHNPNVEQITRNILNRFRWVPRTDLFARGTGNSMLYRRFYQTDAGTTPVWGSLSGQFKYGPSAVVSVAGSELRVYAIGFYDDQVWQNSWNGTGWVGWGGIDNPPQWPWTLDSDPAAISDGKGHINLFVKAHDASLNYHIWHRDNNSGNWSAWDDLTPLGFNLSTAPTAVSLPNGMAVYAAGADGFVYENIKSGTWSGWHRLDSAQSFTAAKLSAATPDNDGSIYLYARANNGTLWKYSYVVGNLYIVPPRFGQVNGGVNGGPAVAAFSSNAQTLYATVGPNPNGTWYWDNWNGAAWSWAQDSAISAMSSEPAAVSWYQY